MSVRLIRAALVSCLVTLAVSACAATSSKQSTGGDASSPAPTASSVLGSWELKRWILPTGQARAIPGQGATGQPITLNLGNTPQEPGLTGFSGCNRFMGQYTVVNGVLTVPMSPAGTRMACLSNDAMSLEHEFLQGLTAIRATRLTPATNPRYLTLTLKTGDVWEFERFIDPIADGAPGVTRFVYVNSTRVPCNAGAGRGMCYQIRMNPQDPWQLWYGEIEGFEFHPGTEYRLRIVEKPRENPPADASSIRWILDLVVEQKLVKP